MDELDKLEERHAQEEAFAYQDREAQASRLAAQPAVENCVECDEPLPQLRQQMHCVRCVDCQGVYERQEKQFRRGL